MACFHDSLSVRAKVFACATLLVCAVFPSTPSVALQGVAISQESDSSHFRFKWAGSGRGMKKGALEVSFSRYESEDGVLVERFVEEYRTQDAALAELERTTKASSKVIRRGYKTDAKGQRVGTRVELGFKSSEGKPGKTVILWIDGRKIFRLSSLSERHLLDFESQDYPAARDKTAPPKA